MADTILPGDNMKKYWQDCLVAVTAGLIVPMIIVSVFSRKQDVAENSPETTETAIRSADTDARSVTVVMSNGVGKIMDLDTYLTGVVLAEMPAEFEPDALRAQAVVARTYTLKRMTSGKKHSAGDVCTSPECCQAYCSETEFLARGESAQMLSKVRSAVTSTSGQVLLYNGDYIEATYFSCSGGKTEDAVAVWGSDIPYLQSVESPGEENAAYYADTVTFDKDTFLAKLGIDSKSEPKVQAVSYTGGGGVDRITITGSEFTGTQIRSLLGLRSTAFAITVSGDSVTITTKGFGHRVGMSQYGAQAMAKNGSSYEEILAYYYQGTTLASDLRH